MDGDTELYQHLHKLAAINSEEQLESLFVTLWRTRKTGVSPSEKASLQSLLNLQAAGQLDPVLACLRSLTRKCVHENFSSADILKLFPPDLPLGLQNILIMLFQKYQSQWKEEMTREQHPLPRTSVSHLLNADLPTFPSSDMLASPWPRQDNPIAAITADSSISNMASIPPQCDAGPTDNLVILPRLKSMTWKLEHQSKTSPNRVAVITLKLQDYTKSPSGQMEVKFQLTRDSLEAVLRSMTYISEQLSSLVGSSTGPLQKKQKQ
ncbi:uncharacterized protein LOC127787860 [Diospyros lotus]|uniref:uncharacterized protein LOC127787860 n=1 Tax=Diospyros lotus TaxID=55363 RepID=UPI0022506AA2|nr:uncharacterized protein LOC127787860 [Diospyros lotus]